MIHASMAAIGAPYSNASATEGGALYLFPVSIRKKEKLVVFPIAPSGLGEPDHFGAAIAFDGDYVVAGAPDADVDAEKDSGAVYIYESAALRPGVTPRPQGVSAAGSRARIKGLSRREFHAIARVEYSTRRGGPYKTLRGTSRWKGSPASRDRIEEFSSVPTMPRARLRSLP